MPQKSSFFDSAPGDERYYPAREFAEFFALFIGNGVYKGGTYLKVTATGKDANVSVALGNGWINGYKYTVYDSPLVLPIQPATTQDRIDRIVLRLDTSAPVRAVQALVLQGTPAASPVAPGIVRAGDIYDLSLAQVRIKANSSIVLPENITDERLDNTVCGVVTGVVQQADTTAIFNQFQQWLNTKTAEYQKQWNDFMRSVEDSGFATTDYVNNKPWQKRKLTEENGASINVSNGNANNLTAAGFYVGENIANAPATGDGKWYYINVIAMYAGAWVKQEAIDLFSNTYQMRTGSDVGGGVVTWGPWTQDLFTSVANGKQAIATAISGKGIPATGSEEFAALANKISQINTGIKMASGTLDWNTRTISNLPFKPMILIIRVEVKYPPAVSDAYGRGLMSAYNLGSGVVVLGNLQVNQSIAQLKDVVFGANHVNFDVQSNWGHEGFYIGAQPYQVFGA